MLRRSSLVECVSVLHETCLQSVNFFFIRQYVQPCLSKNPKYTFYTIKSSLTLAYYCLIKHCLKHCVYQMAICVISKFIIFCILQCSQSETLHVITDILKWPPSFALLIMMQWSWCRKKPLSPCCNQHSPLFFNLIFSPAFFREKPKTSLTLT